MMMFLSEGHKYPISLEYSLQKYKIYVDTEVPQFLCLLLW